jgi:hypothetical protein
VYFNALTGKTSYALIQKGRRIAGMDNYRYWHRHPAGAPDQLCLAPRRRRMMPSPNWCK